jgi:Tfp pilus assembly protein PilX
MSTRKAMALTVVVTMLIVVLTLAYIVAQLVSNQSRLTNHQVERARAYYAGLAGVNLAIDGLRYLSWTSGNRSLCASSCTANDGDIPYRVDINIADAPASGTPVSGVPNAKVITINVDYHFDLE